MASDESAVRRSGIRAGLVAAAAASVICCVLLGALASAFGPTSSGCGGNNSTPCEADPSQTCYFPCDPVVISGLLSPNQMMIAAAAAFAVLILLGVVLGRKLARQRNASTPILRKRTTAVLIALTYLAAIAGYAIYMKVRYPSMVVFF